MKFDKVREKPCAPCGDDMALTFTPPSGATVAVPSVVFIHSSDEDALIYYTLDGSDPDENSTAYTGKVLLQEGDELRAIAIKGECESDITAADYTILAGLDLSFLFICDGPQDKAGVFDEFEPNGTANDYHWRIVFTRTTAWQLQRIELYETDKDGVWVTGQAWATASPVYPPEISPDEFSIYPAVIFQGTEQLNAAYADSLALECDADEEVTLDVYGQPFVPLVGFFKLVLTYQPEGGDPITVQRVIDHECSQCMEPDGECVPTAFVTAQDLGDLDTVPSGGSIPVGFKFTATEAVSVTHLGRWIVEGNSQTHTLALHTGIAGSTQLATVDIDASVGTPGTMMYGELEEPVTLVEGQDYWVVSEEHLGGDTFYSGLTGQTTITPTAVGTVIGSDAGFTSLIAEAGLTYGPLDFKYCPVAEVEAPSGLIFIGNKITDSGASNDIVGMPDLFGIADNFTTEISSTVANFQAQLLIDDNPNVETIAYNALALIQNGHLECDNNAALQSMALPVLVAVAAEGGSTFSSDLDITNNPALTSVSAPLLEIIGTSSSFNASSNDTLADLDLSSLATIEPSGKLRCPSNPMLVTPLLGAFEVTGPSATINFNGCALDESTVDFILARCVASAGFVAGTVDLSGGTNAAPSVAGAADAATLTGRGITVTTN